MANPGPSGLRLRLWGANQAFPRHVRQPHRRGRIRLGGAWGSYTLLDPDSGVTIVYAEQAEDTKAPYIQRRLRNMVYAALHWEGLL